MSGSEQQQPTTRRPTTSTVISGAIALLVVYILTATLRGVETLTIGLVLGAVTVGGMALIGRANRGLSTIGTGLVVLTLPVAVLYAAHRLAFVDIFVGITIVVGVLVGVGLGQLRRTVMDGQTVVGVVGRFVGVILTIALLVIGALVVQGTLLEVLRLNQFWHPVEQALNALITPVRPEIAMIGLVSLGIYAMFGLLAGLSTAPIVALTPQPRQERVEELVGTANRAITIGIGGGSVLLGFLYLIVQAGMVSLPGAVGALVQNLATAPTVRQGLLVAGTVGYLSALVATGVKVGTQRYKQGTFGWLAEILVSALLVTGLVVTQSERLFEELVARSPEQLTILSRNLAAIVGESITMVLLAVTLVAITGGLLVVLGMVITLGFLRERTAGPRFLVTGIVLLVVGGAVAGLSAPFLFGGLVGLVVVWDLGEFGTGLSEELGADAATRQPELVHATGSLAIGGLLFGGVMFIEQTLTDVQFDPTLSLPAIGIALGATLVLTFLLRG